MKINLIPKRDILFLTYREDLIEQFRTHIEKFNSLHADKRFEIELRNLSEYEKVKRDRFVQYMDVQTVFYYRSDLFRDEQKEKIVDFRNYENDGMVYLSR